tara:strand:+ start:2324 stop:3223 length:900 start_codon:yes stop_codon:yes gene_type:complete
MPAQNIYMEYLHPSMYSMQVSPAQSGLFRYPFAPLVKAREIKHPKNEISEDRRKLDEAESDIRHKDELLRSKNGEISQLKNDLTFKEQKISELGTLLESKNKISELGTLLESNIKQMNVLETQLKEKNIEISNLKGLETQLKEKNIEISNLKSESTKQETYISESCSNFVKFCAEDSEYFSDYVQKVKNFLKSNLNILQGFYSELAEKKMQTTDKKIDFSTIDRLLKSFDTSLDNDIVIASIIHTLNRLKNRFLESDFVDKTDKTKIEGITNNCNYALALLIHLYYTMQMKFNQSTLPI